MTKYAGLTRAERKAQYELDRTLIRKSQRTQISFLGSDLNLRMGVTVIGGCTGKGKSTCSANLLADFFNRYPTKQALVITNEEVSADVLDRIACVHLQTDFYKYRDGVVPQEVEERVEEAAQQLFERIEVVSSSKVDMTCLEDVIDVLVFAASKDYINLVVVDYLQTVTWSRECRELNAYEVSKRLGIFLKDYGRKISIPVAIFAQIQPAPSSESEWVPDFSTRIQGDKTFVNHCIMAIEIIPSFKDLTTQFYIHKDRYGSTQGSRLLFNYERGRLVEQQL